MKPMLKGLLETRILPVERITVSNRKNAARIHELSKTYGVVASQNKLADIASADIVILAVKPFDMALALQEVRTAISLKQLVISVAAGISTSSVEEQLSDDIPVIRAMPNTSCFVQASATAICRGRCAQNGHLEVARQLFSAIGTVSVIDERFMDAVTGLSGTGPAYIYYVVEALMEAGKSVGLSEQICRDLLLQTLYGSAKMLTETGKSPRELRRQVTSPMGTTEAGIAVLDNGIVQQLFLKAVERATERAIEMGRSFMPGNDSN